MPNKSSADELEAFVSNYKSKDASRICFAWNGKHADLFEDANGLFREGVKQYVLANIELAPLELVRDLFQAETSQSRESWGIGQGVAIFAERLLRKDPESFLEDYLIGKFQSFDASCGSAFPVDTDLANRLNKIVQQRLSQNLEKDRRKLLEAGNDLIQSWLKLT